MKEFRELVDEEVVHMLSGKGFEGVKTGFVHLDLATGGLADGDVIVLGGRPSMGKTALACAFVDEIAVKKGNCVLYIYYESSADMMCRRIIAQHSGVRNCWDEADKEEFRNAVIDMSDDVRNADIIVEDDSSLTVEDINEKCMSLYRNSNIRLIVIDYLQLMTSSKDFESRQGEVEEILRVIREIADYMKCPVLVLSQLNRAVESRKDHRPILSDLGESGAIENMADEVMLLYRDGYYNYGVGDTESAELIVAKCKRASLQGFILDYDPITGQFHQ